MSLHGLMGMRGAVTCQYCFTVSTCLAYDAPNRITSSLIPGAFLEQTRSGDRSSTTIYNFALPRVVVYPAVMVLPTLLGEFETRRICCMQPRTSPR
jgi:hypothetical protein